MVREFEEGSSMKEFIAGYRRFVLDKPRRSAYAVVGTPLALMVLWLLQVHSVIFDPVPAVGVVTTTRCAGMSPTFDYRFDVNGSGYIGHGKAKILPDDCGDAWNGSPVDVTYLRGYPSVSIGGSMHTWWQQLGWDVVLGAVVLGPFVLLMMFLRKRLDSRLT
jgi:hypothetical protein